jgi:hypothetical protein
VFFGVVLCHVTSNYGKKSWLGEFFVTWDNPPFKNEDF